MHVAQVDILVKRSRLVNLGGSPRSRLIPRVGDGYDTGWQALAGDVKKLEGSVGDCEKYSGRLKAVVALAGVYREFRWFLTVHPSDSVS